MENGNIEVNFVLYRKANMHVQYLHTYVCCIYTYECIKEFWITCSENQEKCLYIITFRFRFHKVIFWVQKGWFQWSNLFFVFLFFLQFWIILVCSTLIFESLIKTSYKTCHYNKLLNMQVQRICPPVTIRDNILVHRNMPFTTNKDALLYDVPKRFLKLPYILWELCINYIWT